MADIDQVIQTIQDGGRSEGSIEASEFRQSYEGDQEQFIEANPDETPEHFGDRPHVFYNVTAAVIDALSGLYTSEPSREFGEGISEAQIAAIVEVYEREDIDSLMRQADALTRLQGLCAIMPIWVESAQQVRLQLYPRDTIEVWSEYNSPRDAEFVAIYGWSERPKWAQLWSAETVIRFEQAGDSGRFRVVGQVDNPYGVLPFVWIHNQRVIDSFYTCGIGKSIVPQNWHVNKLLTELALVVIRRTFPQRYATNVEPGWRPTGGIDNWITLDADAQVGQLPVDLPLSELWAVTEQQISWLLGINGVPEQRIRLKASATSGVQVIAEQAPLVDDRRNRQKVFMQPEGRLAHMIARVLGTHGMLMPEQFGFSISYAVDAPPIPGPERNAEWDWQLEQGLASLSDILMAIRPDLDRDEAIEELRRIAEERNELGGTAEPMAIRDILRGNGSGFDA